MVNDLYGWWLMSLLLIEAGQDCRAAAVGFGIVRGPWCCLRCGKRVEAAFCDHHWTPDFLLTGGDDE